MFISLHQDLHKVIIDEYVNYPFPYTRASTQVIIEEYVTCPFPYTRASTKVIIEDLC